MWKKIKFDNNYKIEKEKIYWIELTKGKEASIKEDKSIIKDLGED